MTSFSVGDAAPEQHRQPPCLALLEAGSFSFPDAPTRCTGFQFRNSTTIRTHVGSGTHQISSATSFLQSRGGRPNIANALSPKLDAAQYRVIDAHHCREYAGLLRLNPTADATFYLRSARSLRHHRLSRNTGANGRLR